MVEKILLWVLMIVAILAAIILILGIMALFAPITYKIKAEGENSTIKAILKMKWAFGLASVRVEYDSLHVGYRIKLFGISIFKGIFGKNEVQEFVDVLEEEKIFGDREDVRHAEDNLDLAIYEQMRKEEVRKRKQEKENREIEKRLKEQSENPISKSKSVIKKFVLKIKDIKNRVIRVKEFLEDEVTKKALKFAKAQIFNILNCIKPRLVAGDIYFGFQDPANTALAYGAAAAVAESVGKGKLIVTPDFDYFGIKLNLKIKGRFLFGFVLSYVVKLLSDDNIKLVREAMRRMSNDR